MAPGLRVVPACGVAADHDALGDVLGELPIDSPNSRLLLGERVLGLVLGLAPRVGYVVALLAERDHEGDRAAVEDPVTRPGVGARSPGPPATVSEYAGSPRSASSPAASSFSTAAAWSGRGRRGWRCSAPSRTTRRRSRRRRRGAARAGGSADPLGPRGGALREPGSTSVGQRRVTRDRRASAR